MREPLPRIIIVRNEHPLETGAYVLAPQVTEALKKMGFNAELRTIKVGIDPKQIPFTYRDVERTRAVYNIAKELPYAYVFTFHNGQPATFKEDFEYSKHDPTYVAFGDAFWIKRSYGKSTPIYLVEIMAKSKYLPKLRGRFGRRGFGFEAAGFDTNIVDLEASRKDGFLGKAVVNSISESIARIAEGKQGIKIKTMPRAWKKERNFKNKARDAINGIRFRIKYITKCFRRI